MSGCSPTIAATLPHTGYSNRDAGLADEPKMLKRTSSPRHIFFKHALQPCVLNDDDDRLHQVEEMLAVRDDSSMKTQEPHQKYPQRGLGWNEHQNSGKKLC